MPALSFFKVKPPIKENAGLRETVRETNMCSNRRHVISDRRSLREATSKMWAQTCNSTSPLLIVKCRLWFERHATGNVCGTLVLLGLAFFSLPGCVAIGVVFQPTFIGVLRTSSSQRYHIHGDCIYTCMHSHLRMHKKYMH